MGLTRERRSVGSLVPHNLEPVDKGEIEARERRSQMRPMLITAKFPGVPYLSTIARASKSLLRRARRFVRALRFCHLHGTEIEGWMLSSIWRHWVGCAVCDVRGTAAPCWGKAACHGYWNGCGCAGCAEKDASFEG